MKLNASAKVREAAKARRARALAVIRAVPGLEINGQQARINARDPIYEGLLRTAIALIKDR